MPLTKLPQDLAVKLIWGFVSPEGETHFFSITPRKEGCFVPSLKYQKEVRRSLYPTNLAESITC
jgi:hypothetical protein